MTRRELFAAGAGALALTASRPRLAKAQRARQPDPAKLDRIAIMTLDFQGQMKLPGQPEAPARTLELFDVPEMLADIYGVHNIEFQHTHLAATTPAYFAEVRGRLDRSRSRMTNVNLEFGPVNVSAVDEADRREAVRLTRQWIDHAVALGCPRVMINQGALNEETKAWAVPTLRDINDYARAKGVKLSLETRILFPGVTREPAPTPVPAPPAPAAPPAGARAGGPPAPRPPLTTPPTWVLLTEVIRNSGTFSNVDLGNVGAQDQGELHAALRALLPVTAGSLHARVSTAWDLATALRFMTVNLKYDGLFSIEAYGHDAVRNIYNIILDTI